VSKKSHHFYIPRRTRFHFRLGEGEGGTLQRGGKKPGHYRSRNKIGGSRMTGGETGRLISFREKEKTAMASGGGREGRNLWEKGPTRRLIGERKRLYSLLSSLKVCRLRRGGKESPAEGGIKQPVHGAASRNTMDLTSSPIKILRARGGGGGNREWRGGRGRSPTAEGRREKSSRDLPPRRPFTLFGDLRRRRRVGEGAPHL